MASEITYAEVKFKNASPPAVAEVPPETKKHEQHPQKCPRWLPWLISLLLLLVCIALIIVLLAPQHLRGPDASSAQRGDEPTALQQQFLEWQCVSAVPQGKGRGWMCCPKGWKRFGKSCYYISDDTMGRNESAQNCTGMGSHLVVINTEAEQAFLTNELHQPPVRKDYYIGLQSQEVGQWQWVDQTPYNKSAAFWRQGEPSNVSVEMCVVIHTIPKIRNWNDVRCESTYRICEAAAVTV